MAGRTPMSRRHCTECGSVLPKWEEHSVCVKHYDEDCSKGGPCDICGDWSDATWDRVFEWNDEIKEREAKLKLQGLDKSPTSSKSHKTTSKCGKSGRSETLSPTKSKTGKHGCSNFLVDLHMETLVKVKPKKTKVGITNKPNNQSMSNVPSLSSDKEKSQKELHIEEAIQYVVETAAEDAAREASQQSMVNDHVGSVDEERKQLTKVDIKAEVHPGHATGGVTSKPKPSGVNTCHKPSTSHSHGVRVDGKPNTSHSHDASVKGNSHAARSSQGRSANHEQPSIDRRDERADSTGGHSRRRRKKHETETATQPRVKVSQQSSVSKPNVEKQRIVHKDTHSILPGIPSVEDIPEQLAEDKCKEWDNSGGYSPSKASQKRQYVGHRRKNNNLNGHASEIEADSDYQDASEDSQSDVIPPRAPAIVKKQRGQSQHVRSKPRERTIEDNISDNDIEPMVQNQLWDKQYSIPRVRQAQHSRSVIDDDQDEESEYVQADANLDSFKKKVHLVHIILGDKIPEVNTVKKRTKTRTMYQTEITPDELKSDLPVSSVVRSAMDRAHDNVMEQLPKNAINSKCDGFPIKEKAMSSNKKFYAPRSIDFHLEQATIDPQIAPRIKQNNVSIDSKVMRCLDEGYRLSLAAQSTQEYFLAAINELIISIEDMSNSTYNANAKTVYITAAVQKCKALMESVGRSQTDVADCSALGLTQLQLIKRDMLLKQLNIASPDLVEELRSQPVVWSDDVEIKDDEHKLLFRGKTDQIDEYQRKEADRRSANLFLQRQGPGQKDWKDKKRASSQAYDRQAKRAKWSPKKPKESYWESRKPGFEAYKDNKGYKGRGGELGRGRGRGRGKFNKPTTHIGSNKKSI